ncbi:MAG: hypothetical protein HZA01_08225, partial [Nitrospinae bacterium]|nr:hypothetical protein [Nitrospinota bacterium]
RCLWHIPHQLKYVLWKDKAARKTKDWLYMLAEVLEICAIRSLVDCEGTIKAMVASKQKMLKTQMRMTGKQAMCRPVEGFFTGLLLTTLPKI